MTPSRNPFSPPSPVLDTLADVLSGVVIFFAIVVAGFWLIVLGG